MTLLLETRNVSKSYGAFHALEQVSMVVHQGELVSVVARMAPARPRSLICSRG